MIQRTDDNTIILDNRPIIVGKRYRVSLVGIQRGKAVITVEDLRPEPLVEPDIDEQDEHGRI